MLKNDIQQNDITIKIEIKDTLMIQIIPNELKHVIINLINNATDAFIENNITNRNIIFHAQEIDNNVILTITDNAGGISNEIIDKIFQPNFTTKDTNKGTGIGLYISEQILNKNNCSINVKNVELKDNVVGAQFTILFPLTQDIELFKQKKI